MLEVTIVCKFTRCAFIMASPFPLLVDLAISVKRESRRRHQKINCCKRMLQMSRSSNVRGKKTKVDTGFYYKTKAALVATL